MIKYKVTLTREEREQLVSCQVYYDGYLLSLSKKHDKV